MAETGKKPGDLQRPAAGVLAQLLSAKSESDRKNYPAKHNILRDMIKRDPGSFRIDSEEGGIYGLTHAPTGFKIHMPKAAAPPELKKPQPLDPLKSILENAELMGSRGRARKYGRPEPEDRDHDYVVFSDDADEQAKYLKLLRQLGTAGYKLHDRPGGFLTASGNNTDLSVYPTSKRDDIHKAWELIEGGMSKDDAWEQVEKKAEYPKDYAQDEFRIFMKGWKPGDPIHPGMQHHFDKLEKLKQDHRARQAAPKRRAEAEAAAAAKAKQEEAAWESYKQEHTRQRGTSDDVRKLPDYRPFEGELGTPAHDEYRAKHRLRYLQRFFRFGNKDPKTGRPMRPNEYFKQMRRGHMDGLDADMFKDIDPATILPYPNPLQVPEAPEKPEAPAPGHEVSERFAASDVKNVLDSIIEKQAGPTFSRLQVPGGNQGMRHLFQGTGGPIEQGVDLFNSPSDYLDEMMTIPYVGEAPLYSDKKSLWDNIKNLLMRPINRRERQRNEREHLLRTQWAVQSLRDHQVGAPSRGFPGLPGRGRLNYGQQSFQQAQARNLPFISQLILNEPGGYRMIRDTGKASTWLHMGSGYQFTVPNKPDPKDLLNIHVEPPKQDMWASALRWRQGRPTRDDLKKFKLDKASRRATEQSILNEGT